MYHQIAATRIFYNSIKKLKQHKFFPGALKLILMLKKDRFSCLQVHIDAFYLLLPLFGFSIAVLQ
ncbi:hypothetical protein C7N43_32265 [Sphingobacteriales bacterium UPWRP_1]|nr:hypothetical protein B6N25_17475 [Sphingobacteriales bacterium TSM_CSS]PSJ72825.1 hypothetical protein C7N43_32265 [Sphingobacteriales bacterium UPWRP_1]